MVGGAGLVLLAAYMGDRARLRETAALDFFGRSAKATAAETAEGHYRLRYINPEDGAIYARGPLKHVGIQPVADDSSVIAIRYSPDAPSHFQPTGLSFLPLAGCLTLFLAGMTLVLRARKMALSAGRPEAAADVPGNAGGGPR
jgi:hypothetical protein